ncbi:MAG: MBL fold metallo-hydrolase [candidate division KSB1 bacterium]|nr:MBL fold metallo-hydrolase [candidate division KSB1 bacterium]
MILQAYVLSPFATNCYLVGCEETHTGAIIDPGDEPELLVAELQRLGLRLRAILLTHGHIDHVSAVPAIARKTGASVYAHRGEAKVLDTLSLQARLFGLPEPEAVVVNTWLADGDEVEVGSLLFRVVHTPGHTPGSICFLHDHVLFSGDTLFRESVGRTDLPGGSYRDLSRSIKNKLLVLPDEFRVLPGHGEATTIGDERRLNPYL